MRVALPDWPALAVFCALVLSVTLYALTLSTHFPSEHRRASLRGSVGGSLLWGTMAIVVAGALLAIRLGASALPGYIAVLAGGAMILVAPLLLRPFPDSLLDDRGGLLLFSGLAALLAVVSVSF